MSRRELHARPAPPPDLASAVIGLRWPGEDARRRALAEVGIPRLLYIAPGHAPPEPIDLYEDWVRVPAATDDVALRSANLVRRVLERDLPVD